MAWDDVSQTSAAGDDDFLATVISNHSSEWNIDIVLDQLTTTDDLFGVPQLDLASLPTEDCD